MHSYYGTFTDAISKASDASTGKTMRRCDMTEGDEQHTIQHSPNNFLLASFSHTHYISLRACWFT